MLRLRLAILGPAIVLIIAMGILAIVVPDLIQPLMIGCFIVMVVALATVLMVERARRNRRS
ncbi:hypothetical protein MB46_18160 [Arthrobacter alpinus]|nr:hypothetical protein MB46_18160 [Arthrobacter alpinus]